MPEISDKAENYIQNLLKLFTYESVGKGDSNEADMLCEQMIEEWYSLTLEERKQMDELVEALKREGKLSKLS